MKSEKKISIVTVTFNSSETLEDTILSVVNQSYSNFEYIIIDGGSTDGTIEIIKKHSASISYWVSERDQGIYDAMNKGIAIATGEYLNFMNSGDKFASQDVLEDVNNVLLSSPDADILYGKALICHEAYTVPFREQPLHTIWKYSPFCHQATFIRSSLIKEYKYDLLYKIGADHDFFYKAYKAEKKFLRINKIICLFDGRGGTTKSNIVQAFVDKKNIALKYDYSLFKFLYYQQLIVVIRANVLIKRLLGVKMTNRIAKLFKKIS